MEFVTGQTPHHFFLCRIAAWLQKTWVTQTCATPCGRCNFIVQRTSLCSVIGDLCAMAAYDAHVRAFVERWAPDEAMQMEQDHRAWAAGLAACWRMTASEPTAWMRAICVWSFGSVPVLSGAPAVAVAVAEREEWRFDYLRENRIMSSEGYTQEEWDAMMP